MFYEDPRLVRLRQTAPQIVVVAWLPACFLFGLFNRSFLSPKYFADDATIQRLLARDPAITADSNNFTTMAEIYDFLGATGHQSIVQATTMLIFYALLFTSVSWTSLTRMGV